jgi:SAM-dependent methyltransferase
VHEEDATSSKLGDRACWNTAAAAWEATRERMWEATHAVGEGMVDMAAPAEGETVLELAAGTGDTGFLAAERIGDRGLLICSDRSPEMVASARRRAAALGIENVEFREMEAERIGLATASVDVVLCRWGYMLVDDPLAALRETQRVLRPGGRVAFAVWAARDENPWNDVINAVFAGHGLMPPSDPSEPGPFRLGDRAELRQLVGDSGLELVEMRDLPVLWSYAGPNEYWDTISTISPSISRAAAELPEETVAEMRAELAERSERFLTIDGRLELPGVSIAVLAR